MKELYDKVIAAYKLGDENAISAAARNWVENCPNNPFEPDTEANNLYFEACRNYRLWKSNGISSRVSKVRMVNRVKSIAALDLPNPYEKAKPKKKIKQDDPVHVLGIIPEETKTEHLTDTAKETVNKPIVVTAQQSKEPLNDTKKGFFSKRKKR